ncbi:MAG: hypothetical protein LN417_01160 [Candidatus Thermoplasmatota archaeon]|nr:hypothetical protein [Candidatus Thermoplasmatota archaeon]
MNDKFRTIVPLISCLLLLLVLLSAASTLMGYSGGWRDDDEDYNCGGTSCHSGAANHGAGTIEVSLDKTSVLSGQSLTIAVNVTETQLGGDSLIGVFLLSSQTGSNDHPSNQGWTIAQDPNGGTVGDGSAKNYVEKVSPGSGVSVSFKWNLEAPPTPGDYDLFVRVHHGSVARNALWEDYEGTISVEVTPLPSGTPEIHHEPASVGYVEEATTVTADVVNATKVFLYWRLAGESQFNSSEMLNTSVLSDAGWAFEGSLPPRGVAVQIEYYIVATHEIDGGPLVADTAIFTVSIEPRPEIPNLTAWTIQIVIITEVVVFAAIIGWRISKSRAKKEGDRNG